MLVAATSLGFAVDEVANSKTFHLSARLGYEASSAELRQSKSGIEKLQSFTSYHWFYASYRNKIRIVDCKNEKKNENMKSVLIIVFSDIKRSEWWLSSSLLSASWARLDWPTREVYLRISMPREHVRDGTSFLARLMDDLRTCTYCISGKCTTLLVGPFVYEI